MYQHSSVNNIHRRVRVTPFLQMQLVLQTGHSLLVHLPPHLQGLLELLTVDLICNWDTLHQYPVTPPTTLPHSHPKTTSKWPSPSSYSRRASKELARASSWRALVRISMALGRCRSWISAASLGITWPAFSLMRSLSSSARLQYSWHLPTTASRANSPSTSPGGHSVTGLLDKGWLLSVTHCAGRPGRTRCPSRTS